MTSIERLVELRKIIVDSLSPLINHNYRYLMMCDHQNIGDTLIMEGEFQFLKTVPGVACREYTTMVSFQKRCPKIPKDDLLIMRGSGSFGDIWPTAPNFWKFVMTHYPDNPILFMPQTIHFIDRANLDEMASIINNRKKVVLCVRDEESYKIAKMYFKCGIHLVPDMAFYVDTKHLKNCSCKDSSNNLLVVKRNDSESKPSALIDNLSLEPNVTVSDWPTFSCNGRIERYKNKLLVKEHFWIYDMYIRYIYRRYIIRKGVNFLTPFSEVYATRMHAGILALLMGKKTHFVDNSYGKLSRVFNTWLQEIDNVSLDY